jgi:hypothetical protein
MTQQRVSTAAVSLILVVVGIGMIAFSALNIPVPRPTPEGRQPWNWFNLGWAFVLAGVLLPL